MGTYRRHDDYPRLDANAVLWSSRPTEGDDVLVMMHGWSYDERHLFAFRDVLPPEVVVASVRAPIPEAGGYAWFPSAGNPIGDPRPSVANAATEAMLQWCDTLPAFRTVGLMGFSQGGAMVLQMMRHRPASFAWGVQLGGFVVDDVQDGDAELARIKPAVFWGRGAHDRVIPRSAIDRTAAFSIAHLTLTDQVYDDLGHDVAGREVRDLALFVAAQVH